jgi:hypothetical protein
MILIIFRLHDNFAIIKLLLKKIFYMKKLYLISALLFSIASHKAQAEEAKHACQSSEMAGFWQTAGFNENPPGPLTENFKKFPYDYFMFDNRGDFAYQARQKAVDINFKNKEDFVNFIKEFYNASNLAGKFNFNVEGGILTFLRDDKAWQKFQCFIIDADTPNGLKKDDMILIGPALVRIERRVFKK